MKSIYYVSLWLVLLVCGGKGLAQTSSTDKPNNHKLYATIRVGDSYGPIPDCKSSIGVVNQIYIGWQMNSVWRLGVSSHLQRGPGSFDRFDTEDYQRRFWGTGIQLGWRKGRIDLSLEAGHAWAFEELCFSSDTENYVFRSKPGPRPYISLSPAFYVSRHVHLFVSWLQTAKVNTYYSYNGYADDPNHRSIGYFVIDGGDARWSISALEFGLGVRLGR